MVHARQLYQLFLLDHLDAQSFSLQLKPLFQLNLKMSLFYKLSILMGTVVVASNYLVQFPIKHFGLSEILTYGAFSYPITFLITDLANRAFGKNRARHIVLVGFFIGI